MSIARVRGRSMTPALHPGDFLWIERGTIPRRGQIALIEKDAGIYVKRIIGLPGEKIEILRERVSIDGNPLAEPYVPSVAYLQPHTDVSVTLSASDFFVLGDARDDSLDSRAFGPIRAEDIKGVATRRLWPIHKWSSLVAAVLWVGFQSMAGAADAGARVLAFASGNWLTLAVGQFVPGRGWIQAADDFPSLPPDDLYTLFGPSGKVAEVPGKNDRRPDPSSIPIEWHARIDRGSSSEPPFALAIEGSWPDAGVESTPIALNDPAAMRVVSDFLKDHGIKEDAPILTQAFEADLDGNGQKETLICAHSDNSAILDNQPAAIYALALVRSGPPENGKTIALAGQYSYKPAGQSLTEHEQYHGARDFYRIIAIHDIDGDGHKEITLYRAKDDATQIDVFSYHAGRARKVLSAYKDNYN